MRAVVQRVASARVVVAGQVVGWIERGLLVYVAASPDDSQLDVDYIADKLTNLRIFSDDADKLNLSVLQTGLAVLVVSAFTVLADARKGRRPSFDGAAGGAIAQPLINRLVGSLRAAGLSVETGRFAEYMQVESVNDGPICILLDSRRAV